MTGVIDIGSNSVRLLYDGIKYNIVTQLSEGLFFENTLKDIPMLRTFDAVKSHYALAKNLGASDILVFATEAVRSAKNRNVFVKMLEKENITLDIISAETESKVAFLGAYTGGTQAVLDVGGASSELIIGNENEILYSHSMPLGCVKLKDYSQDKNLIIPYLKARIQEYGKVPCFDQLISIGGTSSSLAAVFLALEPYDTDAVHNFLFSYDDIASTVERIINTPEIERANILGMHPKKTAVLPIGGLIILSVMEYLNIKNIRISERDNLEGYLALKGIMQ
jgi:exopolyphosphatase/guanosine-5'-triphosphate,3'-diphosphate pyrophosphatase